jgi:head-tail adaptor
MAVHARFKTHTLTVERLSRTADGAGGWAETFAPVGELTGSLQPLSAAEVHNADQLRAEARWVFFVDLGSDVARDDELVGPDGRRFRVLSIGDWAAASRLDHIRVDLEEIQHGR